MMMSEPGPRAQRRRRDGLGSLRVAGYRDESRGRSPGRRRQSGADGLGALLTFVLLAAAAVLLAHDPEFRGAVWTFVRNL
jgi:hypothetical protein